MDVCDKSPIAGDAGIVVIGAGNLFRGDDAAGILFARRIKVAVPDEVRVVESNGDPAILVEALSGAGAAVIVDAVHAGESPGVTGENEKAERIYRFEAQDHPLPAGWFGCSTHSLGVAEAIELARALGKLPRRLVVYGIPGRFFGHNENLSPEVSEACDEVVSLVRSDIQEFLKHRVAAEGAKVRA